MTERITTAAIALRSKVDLDTLVKSLDFIDEEVADAAKRQPAFLLVAGIYRVRKMRKKQRREAKLKLYRAQKAKQIRTDLSELGQRVTDKQVEERLSRSKTIIELTRLLEEAEQEEEFAKLLLDSWRMRGSSLKIVADLVGAEVYVSRRMDGSDGSETELARIRKKIKEKYPGRVVREERRK